MSVALKPKAKARTFLTHALSLRQTAMHRAACLLLALVAVAFGLNGWEFPILTEEYLSAPLQTSFTCDGRSYGYYADVDNNCEVYHVCLPLEDDEGAVYQTAHFSFICGNQTVFNQETLTCASRDLSFPCAEAPSLYDIVNAEFGRVPEPVS